MCRRQMPFLANSIRPSYFLVLRMDDFLDLKQSQDWPVVYRLQKSAQADSSGKEWQNPNKAASSAIRGLGIRSMVRQGFYTSISSNDEVGPGTQSAFYKMGRIE